MAEDIFTLRLQKVRVYQRHWELLEQEVGQPVLLAPGFGRPELAGLIEQFDSLLDDLRQLENDLQNLRAERDAVWGTSALDDQGIRYFLGLYRPMALARIGIQHPLAATLPQIGARSIARWLTVIDGFIDHWQAVNQTVDPPLLLGNYALEDLTEARDRLADAMRQVGPLERQIKTTRRQTEQLYGDVPTRQRDPGSIVARLQNYRAMVQAMLPGSPLAKSLPAPLLYKPSTHRPRFRYGFAVQPDGSLRTWLQHPGLPDARQVAIKAGSARATQPLDPDAGDMAIHDWPDLRQVRQIDRLTLRNKQNRVIARGDHDPNLPAPE